MVKTVSRKKGAFEDPPERKHQRASCNFKTIAKWRDSVHTVYMTTVGLGGCYINADFMPEYGEKLHMEIYMEPDRPPLPCIAQVVWKRDQVPKPKRKKVPKGFAVEFYRLAPEHKQVVDDYVRRMVRSFRTLNHELNSSKPDKALVKSLFAEIRPGESAHLNHVRKAVRDEIRHFRLRR